MISRATSVAPLSKAQIAAVVAATVAELLDLRRRGVPEARAVRKRLSSRLKTARGEDVVAIGAAIAAAPPLKLARARWVGWELINQHRAALASLDRATVEALGVGNSSWDEVDGYGICIAGPAWLRGQVSDADMRRWARSKDLWRRRATLVATVVLNSKSHGGHGDVRRTLAIATLLIDDREDMVVKAMSWALRCLVPWDRGAVEDFLARHEGRLAARIKRETRTKLRTGKKNAKAADACNG